MDARYLVKTATEKNRHEKKCPRMEKINVQGIMSTGKKTPTVKHPHKGGKNGHGKEVHVNNVQGKYASRNEESDKSKVYPPYSLVSWPL